MPVSDTTGTRTFDRVTPRTALIVMPSAHQSFKYLYGSAFRAPNIYDEDRLLLRRPDVALSGPGVNRHARIVWERYTGDWLRTSVSAYWYKADRPDHADRHRRSVSVPRGHLRERGRGSRQGSGGRSADAAVARRGRSHELRAAGGHRSGHRRDAHELSTSDGQGARQRTALRNRVVTGGRGPRHRQSSDHERAMSSARRLPRT